MLNIFESDAFNEIALTDAINKIPFVPGQAGRAVDWAESGVSKLTIAIEEKEGTLALVAPTPRGGPGKTFDKSKRKLRDLRVPHYQIDDGIYADEVQGLREFGQEQGVVALQNYVNARMAEHAQWRMDPTLEHQRLGALKGIILDSNGDTIYNLFTEFGVTQPSEVDFALDNATADGHVRKTCAAVIRTIAAHLGGLPFSGVRALCSPEFFDALIQEQETRVTYLNQAEASELRTGYAFGSFNYGGIMFEEYRGEVGGSALITANKAHFFPVGVPGLYRTYNAPADYIDTVNTIGLPRYARQRPMPNQKGIELELQMNSLSICLRPGVLVQGKTT
jgi:hypothetical protein